MDIVFMVLLALLVVVSFRSYYKLKAIKDLLEDASLLHQIRKWMDDWKKEEDG